MRFNYIYILCLSLSLTLHIFNLGGEEGLKPFHLAAFMSCVLSYWIVPHKNYLHFLLLGFISCVFLSSVFSTIDSSLKDGAIIAVVLYSCYGIAYVNIGVLLRVLIVLIPIDVIVLMVHAVQNPTYRYCAFYNDPNYLCTTLIVMLFVMLVSFSYFKNLLCRAIIVTTIVLIFGVVMMTLSRTGIMTCIMLLLFYSIWNLKENLRKTIIAVVLGLFLVQYYASDFLEGQWSLLYSRIFENNDNLESAENTRLELSMQNFRYIADNPKYLILGLGPSATSSNNARQVLGLEAYRRVDNRDHNTWTSCVSEQGLLAFFFFILIFRFTILSIYRIENGRHLFLMIGLFVSLLLFSFSLWQMTYLPFWWAIFLLNNNQLSDI